MDSLLQELSPSDFWVLGRKCPGRQFGTRRHVNCSNYEEASIIEKYDICRDCLKNYNDPSNKIKPRNKNFKNKKVVRKYNPKQEYKI